MQIFQTDADNGDVDLAMRITDIRSEFKANLVVNPGNTALFINTDSIASDSAYGGAFLK